MKKWTKRLLFLLLTGCLLCGAAVVSQAAVDITDKFTDLNFRATVYEAIGKSAPEAIYDDDVEKVIYLYASYKNISSLNGLNYFTSLKGLYCYGNQLTALPELPDTLENLGCAENQLTSLPSLPSGLQYLYCELNKLTALPTLPAGLKTLNCSNVPDGKGGDPINPEDYNKITALPSLPASLTVLDCSNTQLTSLPALPSSLVYLYCYDNQLTSLPALPSSLYSLSCQNNQLTSLPALPTSLSSLLCQNNKLTTLNVTGLTLGRLNCSYNDMASTADVKGFTGTWGDDWRFNFDPQNTLPTVDPAPFWSAWPPFLVSILRYVLFGWLWMGWF